MTPPRFKRVPWLGRFMDRFEHVVEWLHVLYGSILEWALGHRKSVIAIALVAFFSSFAIVPLVGTEFIPETDEGFISLRLNTPVGSSLEYTDGKVQQVEAVLKGVPEIALAMTTVGQDGRSYAVST
jgi:multidrug efflux pump subunit AcrB